MEHPNLAKSRSSTLNVIERLSIDLNFARINDHNGSKINIKIIDVFSRWIHFAPLLNKTPSSILRILQPFIARIERRTEKVVKEIQLDQGSEFKGVVSEFLQENGIFKLETDPYDSHFPGPAENAHKQISASGRTLLIDSKLPIRFHTLAQQTAVYNWNRSVHADD
jgi:hypothetical protein